MRKLLLVFSVFLFFIVIAGSVSAIAITPAEKTIAYSPGETVQLSFGIFDFGSGMTYEAVIAGDYAGNVNVVKEGEYTLLIDFTMPEDATPGPHQLLVGIGQVPLGDFEGGAISAVASVFSQVNFFVPYPAKYAVIDIKNVDAALGKMAYFTVNLESYGKETVNKITGNIDIIDLNNKTVTVVPLSERSDLMFLQKTEMFAQWDTENASAGIYKIVANVEYDGIKATAEGRLRLGVLSVNINSIRAIGTVERGLVRINIDVESIWNEPIENIYAEGWITKNASTLATLKSATVNLPPWEKNTLTLYWDVFGLEVGVYDLKVLLHYSDGQSKETTTQIYLMEEEVKEEAEKASTMLYGAVLLLILAVIFLLIIVVKIKGVKKSEK